MAKQCCPYHGTPNDSNLEVSSENLCTNICVAFPVMPCAVLGVRQPYLLELSAAPAITCSNLLPSINNTVSYLFLVDAGNVFHSSGLVLPLCALLLVDVPRPSTLPELTRSARCVALLLQMKYTLFMYARPVLQPLRQQYILLCLPKDTDIIKVSSCTTRSYAGV